MTTPTEKPRPVVDLVPRISFPETCPRCKFKHAKGKACPRCADTSEFDSGWQKWYTGAKVDAPEEE